MSFNQKQHLADNIEAIRLSFELEISGTHPTPEQQDVLRKYCGFGGLKCILLPCKQPEDVQKWTKTDAPLFPLVVQLHEVLRNSTGNDYLYKQYLDSLKSSILTAFYTPPEIVRAIAGQLSNHGVVPQHFLDPSAGTGVFLSSFKEVGAKENVCFEIDLMTGKILKTLYP